MEELKLYHITEDWIAETFPGYSFTSDFLPFAVDNEIKGLGKVFRMDGLPICRVTDVEVIPWIGMRNSEERIDNFHAADPEFFDKITLWIKCTVVLSLDRMGIEQRCRDAANNSPNASA